MKGCLKFGGIILIISLMLACGDDISANSAADKISPAAIDDLHVIKTDSGIVVLRWTATGDDGMEGTAAKYDIRYSDDAETLRAWEYAQVWPAAIKPLPSGEIQTCTIRGLYPYKLYYFAVRAIDEAGNASEIALNHGYKPFADFVVNFPDQDLQDYITSMLSPYEGEILYSQLQWLPSIRILRSDVSSLSGVEFIGNLKRIEIVESSISDLSPLEGLAKVESVDLYKNQISSITSLTALQNINYLDLQFNDISDIQPLSDKVKLETLFLRGNRIADISPLSELVNLEIFGIDSNLISDASVAENFQSAVRLNFTGNRISDISAFNDLKNLEILRLADNRISYIDTLGNLPSLLRLDLSHNELRQIGSLDGAHGLESVRLNNNHISDLDFLKNLDSLHEIFLDSNDVVDISPILENSGLGEGDNLYLRYNPLSNQSIDEYIPALEARGVKVVY